MNLHFKRGIPFLTGPGAETGPFSPSSLEIDSSQTVKK